MASLDLRVLVARPGGNDAEYQDPFLPGRPVSLRAACPKGYASTTPVLFVHHGDLRNGGDFRDFWRPLVDEAQLLVIVPEFAEALFPGSDWYSLGNRLDADGREKPRVEWTYGLPGRIFASLQRQGLTACRSFGLFGHSSGGQFVHRAMSLGFRQGVAAAVSANAGTYAMPDLDVPFPYGLGNAGVGQRDLEALLEFRMMMLAGTADTDTASPHFPAGDEAMRQGPTRYARAHRYVSAGRDAAMRLGRSCAWTILDVPDVGHDGKGMSIAAAPILAAALHATERALGAATAHTTV